LNGEGERIIFLCIMMKRIKRYDVPLIAFLFALIPIRELHS
jgi:hypothetical protein